MSVFRFKQFTIDQDLAGMKVGTDSIILGSAIKIKNKYKDILGINRIEEYNIPVTAPLAPIAL